jgi:hypothetical protein
LKKSGCESFFIKKQGFAVRGSFGVVTPLPPLTASLFFKKRIIIHYNAPKFSYKIPLSFIFLKSYKIISKRGVSPYGFGGDSRPPLRGDSPLGVAVFTTPIM